MKSPNQTNRFCRLLASAQRGLLIATAILLAGVAHKAEAQATYTLTNAWFDTNGFAHIATGGLTRGISYSVLSNIVFVSTRNGATTGTIDALDGTAGALLSGTNIVGGNVGVDQTGVSDDGILYGAPLNTGVSTSAPFQLLRWTNWSVAGPTIAYSSTNASDPLILVSGTKRVGDSLAVTGAGVNTLVLAAISAQCTNFLLLHTVDGVNFTSTIVSVPNLPTTAGVIVGITFYTNNSFLIQPGSGASSRSAFLVSYPANFASQSNVVGTVLTNAAVLNTSPDEFISYSPAGQLLASAQTGASTSAVQVVSTTNFPSSTTNVLASATIPTPNANGNATGGAALGGKGKTNYLYVLESNTGVQAYGISYSAGAVGPTVSAPTGGITNAYPPQTLSVSATGTPPLAYQWYSITGGVTNIVPGATSSNLTVTMPVTNLYFVVVSNNAASANVVTSSTTGLSLLSPVTNSVVSILFNSGVNTYSFLQNDDKARGIAYDTNTQNVAVTVESAVYLINGNTGATNGSLNVNGISASGTFLVNQVGIADDGVVYGGSLAVAGQPFTLNSWPAATNGALPYQAYQGDPGNDGETERFGDSMAVRGAGVNTQILVPSKSGTNVALLTTSDGVNFSAITLPISGVPAGFAGNGIAFGKGNTFFAKKYTGDLYEVAYDPVVLTNTVVFDYTSGSQFPSATSGVAVDLTNNILASVDLSDVNNDLQLFQLTGNANAPVLFDQAFFASHNVNGNENAAVVMKYPRAYAVDANNGIVGVTYGVPASTAPTITAQPSNQTAYTNTTVTFTVSASGSLPLYYQWQFNGANIAGATNQTYSIVNPSTNAAGNYDVVINNIAGSVTSATVTLTVLIPVTSTSVTTLYRLAPGSRSYLDTSYNTRGLAYDTNTGTLLVCQIPGPNIYVLNASNGADLFQLNTAGLPTGGYSGFILDQIAVADDGVVYAANLADTANGNAFSITSYSSVSSTASEGNAYGPGNPGAPNTDRYGDTLTVRGAGVNTQILIGSYDDTNVVLFTTPDGSAFNPIVLNVSDTNVSAGFASSGIAFGSGNTFWAKGGHFYNLRLMSFNTNTGTATVLQTYAAGTQTPNDFVGLSFDTNLNILGGVNLNDSPNDFQLYQTFNSATAPALLNQAFFLSQNPNAQDNGVSILKGGLGFALDVNNGIVAISYTTPPALVPFQITSISGKPGPGVVLTFNSMAGFTYQVEFASALSKSTNVWSNLGSPITATGSSTSYTDTNSSTSTGFYRVVGY